MQISKPLRTCRICGLEAHIEEDLEKFVKSRKYLYGRRPKCKKCGNLENLRNKNPLVIRYYAMTNRCYNPTFNGFHNYGGRGITVCEEWRNDRQAFIDWAKSNGYKKELQLDRIDNDGPYSPDNCRWVTFKQQRRNTRFNTTNWEKGTRICTHCKIEKPFSEFHKTSNKGASGHSFVCKPCKNTYQKKHYQKRKHRKLLMTIKASP